MLKSIHGRSLVVDVQTAQYGGPKDYPTTEQMIGWLSGIKQVSFHGLSDFSSRHSNENHKWEFLSYIIAHCGEIEHLEIDGSIWNFIFLSTVLKLPSAPNLKRLIIRGLAA